MDVGLDPCMTVTSSDVWNVEDRLASGMLVMLVLAAAEYQKNKRLRDTCPALNGPMGDDRTGWPWLNVAFVLERVVWRNLR